MILFAMSLFAVARVEKNMGRNVRLTVFARGKPKKFDPHDTSYKCICILFNTETGSTRTCDGAIGWQAGYLVVHVFDVAENDLVRVRVVNGRNETWECEDFPARSRNADLLFREANSQPVVEGVQ